MILLANFVDGHEVGRKRIFHVRVTHVRPTSCSYVPLHQQCHLVIFYPTTRTSTRSFPYSGRRSC